MKGTIENLTKAFIGEERNRHSFYSKITRKGGFDQIAEIFLCFFILDIGWGGMVYKN